MDCEDFIQNFVFLCNSVRNSPFCDYFPWFPSEPPMSPLESPLELEGQDFPIPLDPEYNESVLLLQIVIKSYSRISRNFNYSSFDKHTTFHGYNF